MSTNALTAHYVESAESEVGDAFADAFFVCMLLMAVPIKNSAYLVPPVFVAIQALYGNSAFVKRAFLWLCVAVCLATISVLIDSAYGQTVNLPGIIFGIFTYSAFAVILALRCDFTIRPERLRQIKLAVAWFVIIQSVLGLLQFAASGLSDAVCGTFGLLDFRGTVTISQVYLTFNLFTMIMFLLTDMRGLLAKIAIVVGLIACAVAHSGHQTLFLMAALAFVGTVQLRFKDAIKIAAALCVLLGLTATVSTIYWEDVRRWSEKNSEDEFPKQLAAVGAAEIISSPKNLLLGVGMGQFGSRAALISSGEYLSVPLPRALVGESDYFRAYLQPAQDVYADIGEGSAISQPFCSAMNMVVEFGVPLSALLLIFGVKLFMKNRRLSRSNDPHTRAVGIFANVGLIFVALCCLIENYLEFPQAIFLPALLYVVAQVSTVKTDDSSSANNDRDYVAGEPDA